jgi:hypothetical protein
MRSCRTLLRAVSRPQPALTRSRPSCLAQVSRRTLISAADLQFGQPLHETHPHLIAPGDCKSFWTPLLFSSNTLTLLHPSDSRNLRSRVPRTSRQPRESPPKEHHRRPRFLRHQIPIRCRLLRISPRAELLLPDRYYPVAATTQKRWILNNLRTGFNEPEALAVIGGCVANMLYNKDTSS